MSRLNKLGKNTYYISGFTNLGLYVIDNTNDVVLIDSGLSSDASNILNIIKENSFNLKYIINTHSHADHSGGNNFLLDNTDAKLITSKIERAFLRNGKLDIGFLYGGYPLDEFDNALMHIDEQREILTLNDLPEGLSSFKLPGHHYDMIGIKTSDDVYFVADAIGNPTTIDKEHVLLIFNVTGFLDTLDMLFDVNGIIVPAHVDINLDMKNLIKVNRDKIYEIILLLLEYLITPHTIEDIVSYVFNHYELKISYNKYLIITSTIRSYLAYLSNKKNIINYFENNKIYFVLNK